VSLLDNDKLLMTKIRKWGVSEKVGVKTTNVLRHIVHSWYCSNNDDADSYDCLFDCVEVIKVLSMV